jgi:hypothetical protein
MPNRRSPDAALSPWEAASLRLVANDLGNHIPTDHRDLLIRMQLAQVDDLGGLVLTDAGRQRAKGAKPRREPPSVGGVALPPVD